MACYRLNDKHIPTTDALLYLNAYLAIWKLFNERFSQAASPNTLLFVRQAPGGRCLQRAYNRCLRTFPLAMLHIKLGRKDSNLRMAVPKTAALPLGDAPTVLFAYVAFCKKSDHNRSLNFPQSLMSFLRRREAW